MRAFALAFSETFVPSDSACSAFPRSYCHPMQPMLHFARTFYKKTSYTCCTTFILTTVSKLP